MQIPNQTGVVRTELQLALQELGRRANSGGGANATSAPRGSGGQGNQGQGD
jgi:hypothetical protein